MNPYLPSQGGLEVPPIEGDRRCWWIGTWEDARNGVLVLVGVAVVGWTGSVAIPSFLDSPPDRVAAQCLGAFLAILGVGVLCGVIAVGIALSGILWWCCSSIMNRLRSQ